MREKGREILFFMFLVTRGEGGGFWWGLGLFFPGPPKMNLHNMGREWGGKRVDGKWLIILFDSK